MSRPALTVKERILRSIEVDDNGCWRWQLSLNNYGYGRIGVKGINRAGWTTAHRAAYVEFRGEIPAGMTLDHTCRVRDCCNPDHLEAVTQAENLRRSPAVGRGRGPKRQTHCVRGHEFTEANTISRTYGKYTKRYCRPCHVDRIRASTNAARAEALNAQLIALPVRTTRERIAEAA